MYSTISVKLGPNVLGCSSGRRNGLLAIPVHWKAAVGGTPQPGPAEQTWLKSRGQTSLPGVTWAVMARLEQKGITGAGLILHPALSTDLVSGDVGRLFRHLCGFLRSVRHLCAAAECPGAGR